MIQIEIIENENETKFVEDVNYFLQQLEEYRFIDIKYSSFNIENDERIYTALILYRVD